jgi:hypothetical protein
MSKAFASILLLYSLLCAGSVFPQPQHHSSGTHSPAHHSSKGSGTGGSKSVHVRGYTKKDGTYVAPYNRAAPGTALSNSTISTSGPAHDNSRFNATYKKNYVATGVTPDSSVLRDKHGKIKRSSAAKSAFERESPCPSTGKSNGRCPGYVVDHRNPLECGGADDPTNMQWQTTADAKAKDKTERSCRI